jgi:phosphoserine phosphatase RsbU/P
MASATPRISAFPRPRLRGSLAQQMIKVQKAAQRITSILDLESLLNELLNDVMCTFGCYHASIWLLDASRNELVLAGSAEEGDAWQKGKRLRVGEQGIVGQVAAAGRPYYAPDVTQDLFYMPCTHEVLSEAAFPLKCNGRMTGVFNVAHPEANAFTPEKLQVLEALADHVAVAVENAKLFQQERSERERLLRAAEEARVIQHALLPKSSPFMPGFEFEALSKPADAVGGDWYDFIPLSGGRWGVALGDVAGKGMAAALLMAATYGITCAVAEDCCTPSDVLTRVNQAVSGAFPGERLVTMVYGVLDPATHSFTFANAGHLPPIMASNGGGQMLETGQGLPLGFPSSGFSTTTVQLIPGTRLLFYSDGVTEAASPDGEEYGMERLVRNLKDDGITPERLLHEVRFFRRGLPFEDDATMVLVRATA